MTNINPIDFSQLIAWLEGKLPEEEAQEIAQQVAAADEETRQVVESLRLLIQDSTVQLENPPEKLRPLLMRRFRAFAKDWQQPSVLQRLVGLLTFDSWQHAAAGVRSAATIEADSRQMVFSVDGVEIALDILKRDATYEINGQILADPALLDSNLTVELWVGEREIAESAVDDLGEFSFPDLAPGPVELYLAGDEIEIMLPPFQLG
ncbi:MAG: hypothetical protein QNJ45_12690 [Ardenticatenaceae bacterium]|nr:hypothetical protein [Ardenticatenaceae bacterium]